MDAHTLKPATTLAKHAKTPFPGASAEYLKAREALYAEEIEFRRHMTRLVEQRRALPPGPVIEKDYRFKDADDGSEWAAIIVFKRDGDKVRLFWSAGMTPEMADPGQDRARLPISPRCGRSSTSRPAGAARPGIRS